MPFLNIFSKKKSKFSKTKKQELPTILIDNREKSSLVPSELSKLNHQIQFKQLPVADYLIGKTAIERKTISDLKLSIINKRLISQLIELKQYPNHLLIIEGNQSELYNSITLHENAVRGLLLSISLDYQVPILFSKSPSDTAKLISILAKRTPKPFSLRPSKLNKSKKEQQQFILEGFPNIGPKTSSKLLKHFKSLSNIFNAPLEQLEEIIGKKAKNFIELIK
jgi:ERCC4-type nuclease